MNYIGEILSKRIDESVRLASKIRGFTMIANWFIEIPGFTIYEKMVVIVIKKHLMNKKEAWPSLENIALQAGCSVSSAKRAILQLQRKKVLVKARTYNRKNNTYKLNFDRSERTVTRGQREPSHSSHRAV